MRSSRPRREDWSPGGPAATVPQAGLQMSRPVFSLLLSARSKSGSVSWFLVATKKFYHERSGELGARLCCWARPAWLHSSAPPVALAAGVRELNLKFELVF